MFNKKMDTSDKCVRQAWNYEPKEFKVGVLYPHYYLSPFNEEYCAVFSISNPKRFIDVIDIKTGVNRAQYLVEGLTRIFQRVSEK